MKIGGLQKFSIIDYPEKIAAIIFTQGCNFRCRYCHNPSLVLSDQFQKTFSSESILDFLYSRKGKLDAVTITGGEPTLQYDLVNFIKEIKKMSYLVKLDTNGTNFLMLKKIIENGLIDYIAMDIKAPFRKYQKVIQIKTSTENIQQSINYLLKTSKIDYEFRTTIIKSFLSESDLTEIAKSITGAKKYYLQKFASNKIIDNTCNSKEYFTDKELIDISFKLNKYVKKCSVR